MSTMPDNHRWHVQLTGAPGALRRLLQVFCAPDLSLEEDDDGYCVVGSAVDVSDTAEQAESVVQRYLPLINFYVGAAAPTAGPVATGGVWTRQDGSKSYFVQFTERMGVIDEIMLMRDGVPVVSSPPPPSELMLEPRLASSLLARVASDDNVAQVLRLWSRYRFVSRDSEPWAALYRVLEAIEADPQHADAIVETMDTGLRQWFTMTANHPAQTGDAARHASMEGQPKRPPMALRIAEAFIQDAVAQYLLLKST